MNKRVLITGGRSPAALEIARAFSKSDYEVHVADSVRTRITQWSNHVTQSHLLPPPRFELQAFIESVLNLAKVIDPTLIIPTCEEVFYLAHPKLRKALGERLFVPELAVLDERHNKYKFAVLAQKLCLNVPESHLLNSNEDLKIFNNNPRNWVFKRCYSRFGENHFIRPNMVQLAQIKPSEQMPWMAQKALRGTEVSFYAISWQGRLCAFAAYEANWRLKGGASISFGPVEKDIFEKLKSMAKTLCKDWTGQFSCDAIVDENNDPWLIECNPRATSGVHFMAPVKDWSKAFNRNNPHILLPRSDVGSYHILPAMLFYGLPQSLARLNPGTFLVRLVKGHDVIGISGDRRPFIGALIDGLNFTVKGWWQGISATAATTVDIEWNGDKFE